MTLERWLVLTLIRHAVGALLLAALGLCLVTLIEAGASGRDPLVGLLRAPLVLREALLPVLGVSLALALARLRDRRALLSLGAAGVGPARLQLLAALSLGLVGTPTAAALELLGPVARDAATEREARGAGRALSVAGRWAATERGLLQVTAGPDGALTELRLVEAEGGALLGLLEAGELQAQGDKWVGDEAVFIGVTEDGAASAGVPLSRLPPPDTLQRLVRRGAPVEGGLWELGARDVAWRRHRGLGLVSPMIVGGAVAAASLGVAAPPALAVLVGGLALGAWQLAALALAGTPLSGGLPLAALALVGLGCAALPTRWGPRPNTDSAE